MLSGTPLTRLPVAITRAEGSLFGAPTAPSCGQIADQTLWSTGIGQYRVWRTDGLNLLKIAISPGVIIGPKNLTRVRVVDSMPRWVGFRIS